MFHGFLVEKIKIPSQQDGFDRSYAVALVDFEIAFNNDYLVLCCELGSVIGTVMQGLEPRLTWLYDSPYWESALYDPQTGSRLNVFFWAVKRMSEHGPDDSIADKIRRSLELLHV